MQLKIELEDDISGSKIVIVYDDFSLADQVIHAYFRQDSVAGSVNQATGLPDFEDGLRTGTKLEVRNGLQSVRTIPGINLVSPLGLTMTLGAVWGHKFLY